jgi:hypothetical protein
VERRVYISLQSVGMLQAACHSSSASVRSRSPLVGYSESIRTMDYNILTSSSLKYPNPVIHQLAYAALQVASYIKIRQLMQQLPNDTPASKARYQECQRNFYIGLGTFLLGFAIWNVDNIFCDGITSIRAERGEFWSAVTQGWRYT